jgi:hypothetical protein
MQGQQQQQPAAKKNEEADKIVHPLTRNFDAKEAALKFGEVVDFTALNATQHSVLGTEINSDVDLENNKARSSKRCKVISIATCEGFIPRASLGKEFGNHSGKPPSRNNIGALATPGQQCTHALLQTSPCLENGLLRHKNDTFSNAKEQGLLLQCPRTEPPARFTSLDMDIICFNVAAADSDVPGKSLLR